MVAHCILFSCSTVQQFNSFLEAPISFQNRKVSFLVRSVLGGSSVLQVLPTHIHTHIRTHQAADIRPGAQPLKWITLSGICNFFAGYLLLRHGGHRQPITRQLPWYPDKIITGMTFDPSGTWLLTATAKGNLYMVPALALLVGFCIICRKLSNFWGCGFPSLLRRETFFKSEWFGFCGHVGHQLTRVVWSGKMRAGKIMKMTQAFNGGTCNATAE